MKKFDKVTIIGVGLIGGSIGLALKKRKAAAEVVGVFRHRSTLTRALRCSVVDRGVMSIAEGVKGADLVVICAPVRSIPSLIKQAADFAGPAAVITDVGSTKAWIVSSARKLLKDSSVRFVGSHPMAGSEKTGVEASRQDLFDGSSCIVTGSPDTDKAALRQVIGFWRVLGARVKEMTPAEHDRAVSFVSHLPHVVAFSLAGSVPKEAMTFAAQGFKDTTRIAASDPELWADIFLTNRTELAKASHFFKEYYGAIMAALAKADRQKVVSALEKAKRKRETLADISYASE